MHRTTHLSLLLIALLISSIAPAQDLKIGMTKNEVDALVNVRQDWKRSDGLMLTLSPIDSPRALRNIDHGTFNISGYRMFNLVGTLTYRLSIHDTIDELSWRSDYLTFGEDRHASSRAYWEMLSAFAHEYGVAASSQDPKTLIDRSYWQIDEGRLNLIYDSRFPHIFVTWTTTRD